MNPQKCSSSCDGPQVQHKNTHPQQNQQEVSSTNTDCGLSQANFISPRVNARLKRKLLHPRNSHHQQSHEPDLLFPAYPRLFTGSVCTKTKLHFISPYCSPVHDTSDGTVFLRGSNPTSARPPHPQTNAAVFCSVQP